jgi:type I restriction-modification system DNA methylase subunit
VPNGVLFGSTNAATSLRELLLTECDLQAVINLPSGVFKPYSGVGTAALIFEKGKKTESVWFYDLTADGYSLDDKRTPIEANDIPDALTKRPNREEGPNSYGFRLRRSGRTTGASQQAAINPSQSKPLTTTSRLTFWATCSSSSRTLSSAATHCSRKSVARNETLADKAAGRAIGNCDGASAAR